MNQMIIGDYLESMGVELKVANDGEEAVELAFLNQFDLILMDLEMPNMDGKEAATNIRHANGFAPIVALTGHDKHDDRVKSLRELGFNGFIQKPVEEAELQEIVSRFLK